MLDDAQQRQVLAAPPSAFDDDRGSWGLSAPGSISSAATGGAWLPTPTRPGSRSRRRCRAAPDDGQRHALLGLALAYLGRKAEAIREGNAEWR